MTESLVRDAHMKRNRLTWRDLFRRYRPPTALQLACSALEECLGEQLEQQQRSEYHLALVGMLAKREKRLRAEVQRLSHLSTTPLPPIEGDDFT
jgi:hypothetical protein